MKSNQGYRVFVYAYGLRHPHLLNVTNVFVRTSKHRGFNFNAIFITKSFKNLSCYSNKSMLQEIKTSKKMDAQRAAQLPAWRFCAEDGSEGCTRTQDESRQEDDQ